MCTLQTQFLISFQYSFNRYLRKLLRYSWNVVVFLVVVFDVVFSGVLIVFLVVAVVVSAADVLAVFLVVAVVVAAADVLAVFL